MSVKKSIFIASETEEWIKATSSVVDKVGKVDTKWSESINATFEQFIYILEESLSVLADSEWSIIFNAYENSHFPAHAVPARVASDIMTVAKVIDIADLPNDCAELVRKIHAMNQAEMSAILYVVQLLQPLPKATIKALIKSDNISITKCIEARTSFNKTL